MTTEFSPKSLKIVLDKFKLSTEDVDNLDINTKLKFIEAVGQVEEELKYNELKYYQPFDYQKEFHSAGGGVFYKYQDIILDDDRLSIPYLRDGVGDIVKYVDKPITRRASIGATRTGKTVAAGNETAMHLTNRYPLWWDGRRYDLPVTWWCFGESWPQVARVIQQELFGTEDIRVNEDVGTGTIPRECIDFDTMQKDGPNVLSCRIRRDGGGYSTIAFFNYNQLPKDLQGSKVDGGWVDECPPDAIWDELNNRTAITNQGDGIEGTLLCSFVPLKGKTGVVRKFISNHPGFWYKRITMYDVPEKDYYGDIVLTPQARDVIIEGITDPLEIEPRVYGIPKSGAGAAFPWGIDESKFNLSRIPMQDDWLKVIAIDPAKTRDKTVLSWLAKDESNNMTYCYRQEVFRNRVLPEDYVHLLLEECSRDITVVWPSDSLQEGRYTNDGTSLYSTLSNYGVKMHKSPFTNPPDELDRVNSRKNPGINHINWRLKNRRLKIENSCLTLFDELHQGEWSDKNIDKYIGEDDCIDSMRYGIMSLEQGIGDYSGVTRLDRNRNKFKTLKNKLNQKRFNNGYKKQSSKRGF